MHIGDGEFIDVERKAELGGNIHAKGMMIMQAFLMSELELEQQLPFTASLTFEQSYSEVDGDSASMAANACFTSSDCHAGSDALALMAAMVSLPTRRAR